MLGEEDGPSDDCTEGKVVEKVGLRVGSRVFGAYEGAIVSEILGKEDCSADGCIDGHTVILGL